MRPRIVDEHAPLSDRLIERYLCDDVTDDERERFDASYLPFIASQGAYGGHVF